MSEAKRVSFADVDTTGMERRNVDVAPLNGYTEGEDYFVTGPHSNGLTGHRERFFVEYHCNKCVWSNPYPERMKGHLDAGLHLHRHRDDMAPPRKTAGPAGRDMKDVEVNG